jgi:outer membrane immunogenic protein
MKYFKSAISLYVATTLLSPTSIGQSAVDNNKLLSPIASYNWTGIYAGINAGLVWHTMNITDNTATTFNATIQQATDASTTGGIQVGYRYQLTPTQSSGIFGLELSTDFARAKSDMVYGSPFGLYQLTSAHELKNVTLAQIIAGIAADRTLMFLSAGLSWSKISGSVINQDGIPFFNTFGVSQQEVDAVVGGGVEYAMTNKISTRVKVDVIIPQTHTSLDNASNLYTISNNIILGTIGINYHFG